MDADTIKPALKHCTHLVYAFAKINPETLLLEPLIEYLDVSRGNYKNITELKYEFRGLKVLLSVGGTVDLGFKEKYFDSVINYSDYSNLKRFKPFVIIVLC